MPGKGLGDYVLRVASFKFLTTLVILIFPPGHAVRVFLVRQYRSLYIYGTHANPVIFVIHGLTQISVVF